MRQDSWYSDNGRHLNNHIWCSSNSGGMGIHTKTWILHKVILNAFNIIIIAVTASCTSQLLTLFWRGESIIIGKVGGVKYFMFYLLVFHISWLQWYLLDFSWISRAFSPPSLLHGPLPRPESGAPQTLPLMNISAQYFEIKISTFSDNVFLFMYQKFKISVSMLTNSHTKNFKLKCPENRKMHILTLRTKLGLTSCFSLWRR